MKRKLEIYGKSCVLILSVATILAVLNPLTVSGQTSGTGLDGYTRVLWQGTDSSVQIWKLNGALGVISGVTEGPFAGWVPVALAVGDDNFTRIMWRSTAGELSLWLLDPNLNYYSSVSYGPYFGWLPVSTSVDSAGNERVAWRNTDGAMAVWTLSPNQSLILEAVSYANPTGYVPAGANAVTARGSAAPKSYKLGAAGETGHPVPDLLIPDFKRLQERPRGIE